MEEAARDGRHRTYQRCHIAASRPDDPLARAEFLFEAILGQGARLPSQRRFAARAKSEAEGISLSATEAAQLDRFLKQGLEAV